jgi:mono/diheme cytochrome c family protein
MSKLLKVLLIFLGLLVLLGVLIQLVPYGRDHSNPPVVAEPQWDSAQTRELFMQTCGDCHSNESVWPWYSNIAPVSWLIQRDVDGGREEFNISEWNRKQEGDEAFEVFKEGEMPLKPYLLMHPEARLSDQETDALLRGLLATFGSDDD